MNKMLHFIYNIGGTHRNILHLSCIDMNEIHHLCGGHPLNSSTKLNNVPKMETWFIR